MSTTKRRPLPALVFLVALSLLTALVWWRVIHRGSGSSGASHCTSAPSTSAPAVPTGGATLPTPAAVTVRVVNSTARSGIATKARAVLERDGFRVPDRAANDTAGARIAGVAEIRYGNGHLADAKLLAYYFPTATLKLTPAAGDTVVVSLGRGYKRVATQAEVRDALQRDRVSQGSVAPTPSPTSSAPC